MEPPGGGGGGGFPQGTGARGGVGHLNDVVQNDLAAVARSFAVMQQLNNNNRSLEKVLHLSTVVEPHWKHLAPEEKSYFCSLLQLPDALRAYMLSQARFMCQYPKTLDPQQRPHSAERNGHDAATAATAAAAAAAAPGAGAGAARPGVMMPQARRGQPQQHASSLEHYRESQAMTQSEAEGLARTSAAQLASRGHGLQAPSLVHVSVPRTAMASAHAAAYGLPSGYAFPRAGTAAARTDQTGAGANAAQSGRAESTRQKPRAVRQQQQQQQQQQQRQPQLQQRKSKGSAAAPANAPPQKKAKTRPPAKADRAQQRLSRTRLDQQERGRKAAGRAFQRRAAHVGDAPSDPSSYLQLLSNQVSAAIQEHEVKLTVNQERAQRVWSSTWLPQGIRDRVQVAPNPGGRGVPPNLMPVYATFLRDEVVPILTNSAADREAFAEIQLFINRVRTRLAESHPVKLRVPAPVLLPMPDNSGVNATLRVGGVTRPHSSPKSRNRNVQPRNASPDEEEEEEDDGEEEYDAGEHNGDEDEEEQAAEEDDDENDSDVESEAG